MNANNTMDEMDLEREREERAKQAAYDRMIDESFEQPRLPADDEWNCADREVVEAASRIMRDPDRASPAAAELAAEIDCGWAGCEEMGLEQLAASFGYCYPAVVVGEFWAADAAIEKAQAERGGAA